MTHLKKYWFAYLILIIALVLGWQYYKGKWPFAPKLTTSGNSETPECPAGSHRQVINCIVAPCPQGPCVPDYAGGADSNTGGNNDNTSYA